MSIKKIFPLKLPQNFHGTVKPTSNLFMKYRLQKLQNSVQNNDNLYKLAWNRCPKDNEIIQERKQMIVHPGKISKDTPEWFQTTYDYFRRNEASHSRNKEVVQSNKYDILNQRRRRNSQYYHQNSARNNYIMKQQQQITGKIGETERISLSSFRDKEVAPKVGSLELRDFRIKKPQLKVGKNIVVDTYSPF